MRLWIDEFKWEVTNWHYRYWMGPQIHKLLQEKSSARQSAAKVSTPLDI
ncbi:hypothetical protein IE077_003219 [Cardiosporidium cionae]|uniref:Uncharacterized protein n=1 Tax=Cardiosporidium cionae TaxID=476202 RepID=A0ABQ7J8R9_9APIC|nr:hypothetical protein IE077_003219 [Cardiosporidium cionae]|eukprot:KAF8820391.1 hypothetical protein IE077_003219 [Cardiosporidium cionae]